MHTYETAGGTVTIGPFEEKDVESCLDLFRVVFDREKGLEFFRWQLLDNPVGVHFEVGRDESGRVVSQFSSIPARFKIRGEDFIFGQIIDTIVHPDHRGGLKRKGLYAATVESYVERWGHRDREIIMMGMPNPQHFRIGRRMAGYVPMGRMYFHTKAITPNPGVPEPVTRLRMKGGEFEIRIVERYDADVDALWERIGPRYEIIGVRDATHLNWRYADCPIEGRYQMLEVRDAASGELHGIAVGHLGYLGAPDGIIVDWLVDREVPGAREALLLTIEEMMAKVSMHRVQVLFNQADDESRFMEDMNYELAPSHWRLVSRTYAPEIVTPDLLTRHWYYTLGDFDSV
ncbi:MAG: GNAT family N-acetyltransferase [Planctomycetota bacterium]